MREMVEKLVEKVGSPWTKTECGDCIRIRALETGYAS